MAANLASIFSPNEGAATGKRDDDPLVIGLVNNMPDAALQATEEQFRALLSAAAPPGLAVRLRLIALAAVPRSEAVRAQLRQRYETSEAVRDSDFDGLIVTGMEPRAPDLTAEPYWPGMTRLIDWAEDHARSAIWSCLAAHAAILHLDGIGRQPLARKLTGVFECAMAAPHPLGAGIAWRWTPHSRCNSVSPQALATRGYRLLSASPDTGPDMFIQQRRSLFVFLQGHPEYDAGALLREYRRDIGRFLAGKSASYPEMPQAYFSAEAIEHFAEFRQQALRQGPCALATSFPPIAESMLLYRWRESALQLYGQWLTHLHAERRQNRVTAWHGPRTIPRPELAAAGAPPSPLLFPARAERTRCEDFLTQALAEACQRVSRGSVAPTADRPACRAAVSGFDFDAPRSLDELLSWTIGQLEQGIVHPTHPRYLGLFNPAPTFPAQCGDRIAAAFNPQLASATTSPAAIEIERHTIQAVGRRAGLGPEIAGHFTSGGSEANYTALLCALTRAHPGFAEQGARAFAGPPVFYVSRDSHRAWLKIAHQAGIGRDAVRLVATDGTGRLDGARLAAMVADDRRRGCIPAMIVATAGTTAAGMVDPLPHCAEIAHHFGLWYHIDAAWGGGLIASDRLRPRLAGLERADSVTLDAHKWFATTMGCGMFLSPHAAVLATAFQAANDFMPPSNEPEIDPHVTSIQWSRRFLGLRLFLSLGTAGWAGYGAHVERAVALAKLLGETLAERGWRLANDPALAVLCVEPPAGAGSVRAIVERVLASGQAWVSAALFEGRDVIRACVTHGETSVDDILAVADTLHAAR